jgi:extracellular elastinolytic metalloproteinase
VIEVWSPGVSNDNFSDQVATPTPSLSKENAIASAEQKLGGTHNNKVPTLEYYALPNGDMVLTYVVEVQTASGDHTYEAFVDATTGEIRGSHDFVSNASYIAVDPTDPDIIKGSKNFIDPADTKSSPKGWHTIGRKTSSTKQSAARQVFSYSYDTSTDPIDGQNVDAARVNTFFLVNTIHDVCHPPVLDYFILNSTLD